MNFPKIPLCSLEMFLSHNLSLYQNLCYNSGNIFWEDSERFAHYSVKILIEIGLLGDGVGVGGGNLIT